MNKKLILTFGLCAPLFMFAQFDRSVAPKAGKAPTINIKDSETFKTENGITVILSEDHKLPKVSFGLHVGPGQVLEGSKAGLASLTGSLIMSGTENLSKDELDKKIDFIGADMFAASSYLRLSCLKKHMDKGLKLMVDVLNNPSFPQDEFDRIVTQNESNLMATKSDPGQMARNAVSVTNFPNHPFGEIMTEESLANITRGDVVNFYNKTFVPHNSYLVVIGDISREEVEKVVASNFASWNGDAFQEVQTNKGKTPSGRNVVFVKKTGAVQSAVHITFPVDIKPGNDDEIALKVLNGILGGGAFGNRLMQNLREDKAYTYGARSYVSIDKQGSYFNASGNFRNEVTDSAITEFFNELEAITNSYVKDDELNLTKSSMAGSFARALERPSTIARFALNIIRNELDKDYYKNYLKKLDAVTKEDVLDMAQKYLSAQNCNIIVVGNEEILPKLEKFDADGKIEKLDAFGQSVKEMKQAGIAADELLCRHVWAVTNSSNSKEVEQKLKKIKSVKQKMTFTMSQAPVPFNATQFWAAPNSEAMKMEAQGMVVQKTYFDGEKGYSSNMQTGKSEMTEEEISEKNKSIGLFPEWNYKTSGMDYELLGIENQNGTDMYVLKLVNGNSETYEYYSTEDFMKIKTYSITKGEDKTQESTTHYHNYQEVEGILFPKKISISFGPASLKGEVDKVLINEGTLKDFE